MAPGVWGEPFCMKAYAALRSSGTSEQYAIPQNPSNSSLLCFVSLFAFSRSSLAESGPEAALVPEAQPSGCVSVGW